MNLSTRPLRTVLLSLVLLLAAWAGQAAHAQGTYGQLPDPISGPEVARLLRNYVHPTKEQAESIEALHDSYKERFRTLREGDIEKFLAKMRTMQGGMMPSKEQMDDFMKGYERTLKQIEDVDDSFFEAMAALMGADRSSGVRRAQDARTRTRCASGMMSGMAAGATIVDLSSVVLDSGLDAQALAPLDAELVAYEQKATQQMKELNQVGQRAVRDMIDEMQKAGLGEMSSEDMASDPRRCSRSWKPCSRPWPGPCSGSWPRLAS